MITNVVFYSPNFIVLYKTVEQNLGYYHSFSMESTLILVSEKYYV